jgi:hypothetical protein
MQRGLVCVLVIAATVSAVPVSAQESRYRSPRTENGQPDLQGVWNFSSGVPLQRPPTAGDKRLFTKEESERQRAIVREGLAALGTFAPVEAIGLDWLDSTPLVEDLRTSLISYPANGRLPALVKGARRVPTFDDILAALANLQAASSQAVFAQFAALAGGNKDSYADFTLAERCLFDLEVPLTPQLDGNVLQIVQGRDHVVLVTDAGRRIVTLGGRPPSGATQRQWAGVSTGRWEGETLVVDTRNFTGRLPSLSGMGDSREKIVTERFTRTSGNRIEYAATVVDSRTFQDRIELSFPMTQVDEGIYESGCHEGNRSMRNSLAAARLDDDARRLQRQRGPRQQLTVLDRAGTVVTRVGDPGLYTQAAFSPDASQVAVVRTDIETGNQDVWTFDVASGRGRAVTSDTAADSAPLWSPDGKTIAYASVRDTVPTVFRRAADGSGEAETLYRHDSAGVLVLTDWSRDGRFLTFWTGESLFILPVTGAREAVAVGAARGGRFSPDGRWLAYNASQAGQTARFHAFVRPFDPSAPASVAAAASRQVSQANALGGLAWRADSKELFFLSQPPAQTMMAAEIAGTEPAPPRALFQLPPGVGAPAQLSNISSPDGQRFVFALPVPPAPR